ncbi:hypothetical protein BDV95DRAFT_585093 [Massariosphaeria phaeospora]|uniref:Zn(2)-C6 fungal-type domain-containing protein n=1 Tax=Massariosphaeria phaeospora TaxID=100035 RepID=A0A7C8M1V5_9PLEO|nr:hypothetical protein BDV95DRAFT_585093 [Massariosphaeria phaeospora]
MSNLASSSSSVPSRSTHACVRCADRKVKCDRQRPCSACVKHQVDCVFHPPQSTRKRHKRVTVQVLADRLRHYETLLQERGVDPSKLINTLSPEPRSGSGPAVAVDSISLQLPTPPSSETRSNPTPYQAQLDHGQEHFKFIENSLWTRVVEESHDSEHTLEESNDSSDQEESYEDFGFVLGRQTKSNTRPSHPPSERIQQLWETFIVNVDSLTKVVHVPTLRPAIQKAANNTTSIPRSLEALMFAIYSAAVMSLSDQECRQRFSEPRKALLSRYVSATESALLRAKFMRTTSLVVLQALVLLIIAIRDIAEPRTVWTLTGVAVRIAQLLGLERDGVHLGLPPFETEMRRRIWWQLKWHDFRTAELCGLSKFRDFDMGGESTKWPTNANDDELYPGMDSMVAESNTLTDAIFVILRTEMMKFAGARVVRFRQQGKGASQFHLDVSAAEMEDIQNAIRELEERLETKYLRYCDPSQPLHLLTSVIARYSLNVARFLSHHPRRWINMETVPSTERQLVWEVSMKLLEQHNMVQSNPLLKPYSWHAAYFQQWHAFVHIFDTLRADPLLPDAEKAWQLIGNTYRNSPVMISDMKKPIHIAVGNLCLKAYSDRETALQTGNMYLPPTPNFILQLRQQREAAKAKKQARNAKNDRPDDANHNQSTTHDLGPSPDSGVTYVSDTLESTHLQQNATAQAPGLNLDGGFTESDPFYMFNGFEDNQFEHMDMDLDFMLAPDQSMEGIATEPISWEQWDTWLANSNAMPPLSS